MTDFLQPVDLIPNGPLKALIKTARGRQLYVCMQEFNTDWQAANATKEPLP